MSSKRAGLIWVDAQGEQVLHVITTATGVGAIESAIAAQSNAGLAECWEGLQETFSAVTSVATYPTTRNVAVLLFQDNVGSTARLYVPAPVAGLFNSAGDTVDPTAAAGIIAAAIGNLRAGSGNTVTMFVGGYLSKAPVRALESTDVTQFVNPMTTTGDLIYAINNAGSAGRLGIGASGTILGVSAGIPAWVPEPVGIPLTTASSALGADVAIGSANVFADGPSLSLAAGDWFIVSGILVNSLLSSGAVTAKLWDGATVTASALADYATNGDTALFLGGIVHPTGTTTYKVSVTANAVSSTAIKAAARINGAGNNASYLAAMKIG